ETGAAEGELVEGVAGVIGGDEVEEEGAGGGVAAVDEEAREEGLRGGGERRVGRVAEDVEEGEKGGRVGAV
ncbi:hypothetical protein HN873_037058, partial [Arachis hypogaea]